MRIQISTLPYDDTYDIMIQRTPQNENIITNTVLSKKLLIENDLSCFDEATVAKAECHQETLVLL